MDNVDDVEIREAMKSVQGTWKLWLLVLLVGGAGGYGVYHLRMELDSAKNAMADADARSTKKHAELLAAKDGRVELETQIDELEKTNAELLAIKEAVEKDLLAQETARGALKSLSSSVAVSLAPEIAGKDVAVSLKEDEVIVDISDKLLFDTAEPVVSKKAEDVLARLGALIATVPNHRLEIRGHHDVWEQSGLRATAVSKRLIDGSKIKDAAITVSARKQKPKNKKVEIAVQLPKK